MSPGVTLIGKRCCESLIITQKTFGNQIIEKFYIMIDAVKLGFWYQLLVIDKNDRE